MKTYTPRLLCRLALLTPWALSVHAADITKDASGTDLTAAASWGGVAPGATDTAVWSGSSLGAGLTLGSDATWNGVSVTGAASDIAISGAGVLTLGAGGINMSASSVNASISNAITLGANQSWSVATGRTLTVSGVVSGTSSLTLGSQVSILGTSTTFLTGTAQTLFTNVSLSSVLSASGKIAGGYVNGVVAAGGYFLSNNGTTATFWMEGLDGGYIKGVQVELTQVGADIAARAVAAKYVAGSTLGFDFNSGGDSGSVATSPTSPGYGVHTTTLMSGVAAGGTTVLSAVNTYTGATNIDSGVVRVGVASQAGVGGALGNESAVTLANAFGATLDLNGFDTRIGSLAGGGSAGGNVTLGTGSLVVGGNNADTTYSGVISGAGSLIKIGTGTLDLAGENTYAGGTIVNEGVLRISDPTVNGVGGIRGDVTVTGGGTLLLSVSNALGWAGGSKVNTLNIIGGTVTTEVNADNGWGLAINMTGGAITALNGGYFSMGGGSTITSAASATSATIGAELRIREGNTDNRLTFTVADGAAADDLIVSGPVTQAYNVLREVWKAGTGTLVFSGGSANSYTGLTTVADGTLLLAKNDGVTAVAGNILVNGTGTLRTDAGKSGRIADGANVTVDGSGASFQLGANQNETINTLAVNNGAVVNIGGAGSNLRPNGGITSVGGGTITGDSGNAGLNFNGASRTVQVANAGELLLVNAGIHNGALVKTGAGILSLLQAGDYAGGTTLSGGRLIVGHQDGLGTGAIVVNSGSLESSAADIRGGALTLSGGSLVLNAASAGTLTLGLNGDFVMSSGTWTVDLASGLDQIIGSGTASFTITGGILELSSGLIDYGQSYALITGFTGANSVSGLSIQGYDSAAWAASLNSAGVLSFSSVPEPSVYGFAGAGLLGGISLIRRRRKAARR